MINTLLIWLAIFGVIALLFLPFVILYVILNKKQREFFTLIANKYSLKKDMGKQKIFRAFPVVKGYVNQRWTYVQATSSRSISTVSGTRAKSPVTQIGVKINNPNITHFIIKKQKRIKTKTAINIRDFELYFDIKIADSTNKEIYFDDSFKKMMIEYAKKIDFTYIYLENQFLISNIYIELKKQKYYEEALLRIEMQHKIIDYIL